MKKLMAIAFSACILAACGDSNNDGTYNEDSLDMETQASIDNTEVYTPAEGDVTYRDGKVQVYRTDHWEDANDDVSMDNGVVVYRSGRIVKDGNEYEWEDGYVVDRRGNVWDRAGNGISDAWDATKHGVKKAGQAIGDAAETVGEKTKDVFDGKKDKDND